ncbi:unnamed protein product [Cochlearia groenlandica]
MFDYSPSKKRWNMLSSSSVSSHREIIVLGRYSKSCKEHKQQVRSRRSIEERLLLKWKVLLKKLKLLPSSSSSTKIAAYELSDYSLNFDHDDNDEPENLARSFSSRFADPTRIRATRLLLY